MVSVIIPARNEAARIAATVRAASLIPGVGEIIVVDDGSRDGTADEATRAGATVVRMGKAAGKGQALQRGIETSRGEILLLLDADLGDTAIHAEHLLAPVLAREADMAIAQFAPRGASGGGFGLVVRLARWAIRRATGKVMNSPLSGQRALRRQVWIETGPIEPGFGAEVGLTITALRSGFRVQEILLPMTHRVTGWDFAAIWHRAKQFYAVARTLLRLAIRRTARTDARHS
ncbi:MAG: glycosyltransferase family 2 protein [Chthonomonadales bacterium]